jgi:septal ring factor EnvC (AmiA/AmiB activator)
MQAFSLPSISLSKLDLAISGVETVDAQFREMLSRELNLQRQVRTQQDGINALQTQVSSLDRDLAQAREESGQRATRLSELTQLLAEADERYRLLDQHWRGVSEQELAKQSGSFREKVSQELEETLLALDRENPNMEIALRRLRRIEDILKK